MRIRLGKTTALFLFLFSLIQLSGCETLSSSSTVPKDDTLNQSVKKNYVVKGRRYYVLNSSKGYHKTGEASWYGAQFHGKRTSNNESFNLYAMTAASPELPLPTYIKVKNLQNNKEVVVKVNDRGPFVGDRVLDLSYAAAKKLGFVGRGTTKVDIVALDSKSYKYALNNVANTKTSKTAHTTKSKTGKVKSKSKVKKTRQVRVV